MRVQAVIIEHFGEILYALNFISESVTEVSSWVGFSSAQQVGNPAR